MLFCNCIVTYLAHTQNVLTGQFSLCMQDRSFDISGSTALNLSEERIVPCCMPQVSLIPKNHMLRSGSLRHLLLCHVSGWEQTVLSGSQLRMLIIEINPYYARAASARCFQHESCLFWALCARVMGSWIYWKRHVQGSLISLRNSHLKEELSHVTTKCS